MSQKDLKYINQNEIVFTGGFSQPFFVGDQMTVLVTVVGTGNIVVHGSAQEAPPDFTALSTITNSHAEIVLADYSVFNTYYNGGAGVTVAASTALVELNTNLLTWISFERAVGTPDVLLTITNNE